VLFRVDLLSNVYINHFQEEFVTAPSIWSNPTSLKFVPDSVAILSCLLTLPKYPYVLKNPKLALRLAFVT
jgi:hypothetical protein